MTHRTRYERDGFLVLENFADPATCDALVARAAELVATFHPDTMTVFTTREQTRVSDEYFLDSGDKIRFFFEEDAFGPDGGLTRPIPLALNKIGHALHELDPVFARFSHAPALHELATSLGMAQPLLLQSMYVFKQPGIGGEVGVHQDHTFLWTDPPSAMGLWFALQDATLGNGCLWALPGGHREPVRKRFHRAPGGGTAFEVLDPRELPTEGMVPLEVPKGTLVVLHGLLPHKSGPNHSPSSRHAYTLHLIEASAHYRADNWLQRATPPRGWR